MDMVVMELEDNTEFDAIMNSNEWKKNLLNVAMVKKEAQVASNIPIQLLRHEVYIKPENISTEDKFESTRLITFDPEGTSNLPLEIKSETLLQDCWLESKEISVKEELLHDELDIKSEDEGTQGTCLIAKYNEGNQFDEHMTFPSVVKLFKCNICDNSFIQKSHLQTHLRSHTGEKPFKCNFCDYRCARESYLKIHIRSHTGERPFKCTSCDYSCADNAYLMLHLKTHSGEKPFKCNICEHKFAWKSSLKKHLLLHSKKSVSKVIRPKTIYLPDISIHDKCNKN